MDEADEIKLKNDIDDTDKIKLKNCTIRDDVVVCGMERKDYKKLKKPPVGLELNVDEDVQKNKSIDGIQSTKADSSNKQGCGCSKTTDYSEIANFVAKYLLKNEENNL